MNGKTFVVLLGLMFLVTPVSAILPYPEDYLCCGSPYGPAAPDFICWMECPYGPQLCFPCGDFSGFGYDCYGGYGYGYYCDDDDDGGGLKSLDVALDSSCEENVVTVTSGDNPLPNAKVTVTVVADGPLASGQTDSDGEFTFPGCSYEVSVYANKAGYKPETIIENLVSCAECEEGPTEPEPTAPPPETPPEEPPTAPPGGDEEVGFECDDDDDCADNEYCNIPPGAAGGDCEPVEEGDCGVVTGHQFVEFECGTEEGCPSCDRDFLCVEHECKPLDIQVPDATTGETQVGTVSINGAPCAGVWVEITTPSGQTYMVQTDEFCQFEYVAEEDGEYTFTIKNDKGDVAGVTTANALPQPTPAEEPEAEPGADASWLFLLAIFLLILVIVVYWRSTKKKGRR